MTTTKTCKGWSRYNNGRHSPCDREAGETGFCPIHQQAADTNPLGV